MMIPFLIACFCLMMYLMICVYRFFNQSFAFPYHKQVFVLISSSLTILFLIRFSFRFYLIENDAVYDGILYICSYALVLYTLLFVVYWIIQLLQHMQKKVNFRHWFAGTLILSIILASYGLWNTTQIQQKEYTYRLAGVTKDMDILLVSDLHLSTSVKTSEMKQLFDEAEKEQVDMLWIAGDLFDESTRQKDMHAFCELAKETTIPIYYALGNHEQLSGNKETFVNMLNDADIHVLQDEAVIVDGIQIVGRKDKLEGRKPLSEILVDESLPALVIDHRPDYGGEQIGLQVSGHTHNGQIFPNNIFTGIAYPQLYGCYDEAYPMIVTSGYGTWGFPMRIGSHGESVILHLKKG